MTLSMKCTISLIVVIAASILLTGCVGCTRVGPGYVGIKVNMAGSNRGVSDYVATTGWVYYNMASESVFEYPVFMQTAVWTHNVNEGKAINEEITFTTKDAMQVAADISIAYQLTYEKVPHFYVQFRSDDLDKFTHGYLRNLAREKFDNAAGHFSIDQIMGDNAAFLAEARSALQKELDPIGVQLKQLGFIGAPRPPAIVIQSINAKAQAQQIALQKQTEVLQAEADARKAVAEAEGEAKSQLVRAEAEAEANRKVAASITPQLVEWRKLDKWNGVLPTVTTGQGGGIMLKLPSGGSQ